MAGSPVAERQSIQRAYQRVRGQTASLCETLEVEDFVVQSMPDVSPTKWHLAHTTWFFETFILKPEIPDYRCFHPAFEYLFNSYYNAVGPQFSRPHRGLISRPTVREVMAYRQHVDSAMERFLANASAVEPAVRARVILGLHHEQQHQELMLMDIKHVFSCNPLYPALRTGAAPTSPRPAPALRWCRGPDGVRSVGRSVEDGFSFDNESPRHERVFQPFEVASRCVTNAEYMEFIADGGYRRCEFWLSAGWAVVQAEKWQAPLYWHAGSDGDGTQDWQHYTLGGMKPVDPHAPVVHVSHYEADAYARWAGARLPTEFEWELLSADLDPSAGNFAPNGYFHPIAAAETGNPPARSHADPDAGPGTRPENRPTQMFGDVWEWTASAYLPYPGYCPAPGAIGEYNGKFMSGQMVLRGGCCATPEAHIRATYRNFFPPHARWPFTGIRLARYS